MKTIISTVALAGLFSFAACNTSAVKEREMAIVAKQSGENGAEAKFSLALIQYTLKNYKTSKDKCFEVINAVPSYNYWIGKSFILLADNYIALGDTFQAKHTLKSIVENYEKDPSDKEDIRSMAQEKLNALIQKESEGLKPADEDVSPDENLNTDSGNQ